MHNVKLCKPIISGIQHPVVNSVMNGDLRVVPIVAIDFSLGNLTFSRQNCLHTAFEDKQNDYRDIFKMIGETFKNILHIPIFGFGGRTHKFSNESCNLFPMSRDL